jgi:hypothetical protein
MLTTRLSRVGPSLASDDDWIQRLQQASGGHLPARLIVILTFLAGLGGLYAAVSPLLGALGKLIGSHIVPRLYNTEDRKRANRRQRFADHLESQLRRLDEKEEWRDDRYAELEAEVEAEGGQRARRLLMRMLRSTDTLRREQSLSRALERSSERLILLQGEPGSGKSVALRHVAQEIARRAMRSKRNDSLLPVYLNLKEFRPSHESTDSEPVRDFIIQSINRANSRDIARFLDLEFDRGLAEGNWLFLFDSFDEIPDVLSATEVDATVQSYADAIYDFLHGMNKSRGIIASREFRGPRTFAWPTFRIVPLSDKQKRELVRRADLSPTAEGILLAELPSAESGIQQFSSNPLFLGLLCEYLRYSNAFPSSSHSVFETYVHTRFERDSNYLKTRFQLEPERVRHIAEQLAFCMAAEPGLGLAPSPAALGASMTAFRFSIDPGLLKRALNALEFIKLARSEEIPGAEESGFTFAHRRFQEYFATCVVI